MKSRYRLGMERPRWPYTLGAIGALAFGGGAAGLLFLIGSGAGTEGMLKVAAMAFVLGSATLGIGWIGIFQQRQAGFGVIAGSFAIPIAALVLKASSPGDIYAAAGMIMLVALAFFALAHAFVKAMPFTRFIAVVAAIAFIIEIVSTTAKASLGQDIHKVLAVIGLGGLAVLGISLAVHLPDLRRELRSPDEEGIPRL